MENVDNKYLTGGGVRKLIELLKENFVQNKDVNVPDIEGMIEKALEPFYEIVPCTMEEYDNGHDDDKFYFIYEEPTTIQPNVKTLPNQTFDNVIIIKKDSEEDDSV